MRRDFVLYWYFLVFSHFHRTHGLRPTGAILCETCTAPISTNLASIRAGEPALEQRTHVLANRLELAAVAVLLCCCGFGGLAACGCDANAAGFRSCCHISIERIRPAVRCESCRAPVSTSPASTKADNLALKRGTYFMASLLHSGWSRSRCCCYLGDLGAVCFELQLQRDFVCIPVSTSNGHTHCMYKARLARLPLYYC